MKPKSPRTMKQIERTRHIIRTSKPKITALELRDELRKKGHKISVPSINRIAHGEGLPSKSGSVSSETILVLQEYCDGRETSK